MRFIAASGELIDTMMHPYNVVIGNARNMEALILYVYMDSRTLVYELCVGDEEKVLGAQAHMIIDLTHSNTTYVSFQEFS